MCEGGGANSAHAKQSFPTVQPTAHITIQITIAYVKNHAIQSINEIYDKSTKHLRISNSRLHSFKTKIIIRNQHQGFDHMKYVLCEMIYTKGLIHNVQCVFMKPMCQRNRSKNIQIKPPMHHKLIIRISSQSCKN
jgi:hypothetical protein